MPLSLRPKQRINLIEQKLYTLKRRLTKPKPWINKINCLDTAINFVISNNISGDYFEFGVYMGTSFIHAYKYYTKVYKRYQRANCMRAKIPFLQQKARFVAFDSFEGLPVTNDPDIPLHWIGKGIMRCEKDRFVKNLRKGGVDMDDVVIVGGFYESSLNQNLKTQHQLDRVALVHIDCDLYDSTMLALDFITPFVRDGTVLVFDDFFYYQGHPEKGERGAFNQWLLKNANFLATELCKFSPAASYIINFSTGNQTVV